MDDLDPRTHTEFSGPVGFEKKFHQTHFAAPRKWKRTHPKFDPNWEEYKPGIWRRKKAVEKAEAQNDDTL
ncbi:MAG: hypothetical protein WC714_28960 [Candidatus Obscuribacterales bacterium]|jgi:hypothetical protein